MFIKRHKNYVVTFGTEILVLLLGVLIFRIASELLTELGFSEYNLFRRTISFIQPLLMIGLGVAIPRYVSIDPTRTSLFLSGIIWITISGLTLFLVLFVGKGFFGTLFFGNSQYDSFIPAIALLLIMYGLNAIIYGYLRGLHNVYFANSVQLLNIGILPIIALVFSDSIITLIYLNVFLLFGSCLVFGGIILKKYAMKFNVDEFKVDSKVLLNYGLPRVIGDFSLLCILTLPTYIVLQNESDILIAGDVAYSLTLVNLVGAAFAPISLVLLPEIAQFFVQKRFDLIKQRFGVFVVISLSFSAVGYIVFYLFTDFMLSLLLGESYRKGIIDVARIVLLGSFGYGLYIVLRSFLDALKVRATNAINLMIVLLLFLIVIFIGYRLKVETVFYLYSFVFALSLLGVFTLIQTYITIKKMR